MYASMSITPALTKLTASFSNNGTLETPQLLSFFKESQKEEMSQGDVEDRMKHMLHMDLLPAAQVPTSPLTYSFHNNKKMHPTLLIMRVV